MRKATDHLIAGTIGLCLLLNPLISKAQLLNWLTSFIPSWSNGNTTGNANNVSGTSVSATSTVSISGGSFVQALGSSGAPTPTVAGATFTVPGSSTRMQITPNFSTNSNYAAVVLNYNCFITNVSFRIADIDKNDAFSSTYYDRVTITGSDGTNTYLPTLTRYSNSSPTFLVINNNVAQVNTTWGSAGNSDSDNSDQRGTITVNFGSAAINSITIHYDNAPGAQANPAAQSIAIGSVSFTQTTLPVEFISFTGAQKNQDVFLKWITAQETNSAYFDIERSEDGTLWNTIGAVQASGNSNSTLEYDYLDINPARKTLFYRLKQVDIDGRFKYSTIVRITNKNSPIKINSYPNPFLSELGIAIYSPTDQDTRATISDAMGRIVWSTNKSLSKGNNSFTIPGLEKLNKGVYNLQIVDENRSIIGTSKLVKN